MHLTIITALRCLLQSHFGHKISTHPCIERIPFLKVYCRSKCCLAKLRGSSAPSFQLPDLHIVTLMPACTLDFRGFVDIDCSNGKDPGHIACFTSYEFSRSKNCFLGFILVFHSIFA